MIGMTKKLTEELNGEIDRAIGRGIILEASSPYIRVQALKDTGWLLDTMRHLSAHRECEYCGQIVNYQNCRK